MRGFFLGLRSTAAGKKTEGREAMKMEDEIIEVLGTLDRADDRLREATRALSQICTDVIKERKSVKKVVPDMPNIPPPPEKKDPAFAAGPWRADFENQSKCRLVVRRYPALDEENSPANAVLLPSGLLICPGDTPASERIIAWAEVHLPEETNAQAREFYCLTCGCRLKERVSFCSDCVEVRLSKETPEA